MSVLPHWSAAAAVAKRPAAAHERIVMFANRMLAKDHVKLSLFGGRMRVAGPTGGCEIVENLGALWPALDKMKVRFDPLDSDFIAATEDNR